MKCCEPLQVLNRSLLLLFLLLTFLAGQDLIELKSEVVTAKSNLRLKDIATVQTSSPTLHSFLSQIVVPKDLLNDGVVSADEIRILLDRNYLNSSKFKIVGDKTKVLIKKTKITKEILESAIKGYMKRRYPNVEVKKISIHFKPLEINGNYRLEVKPETLSSNYAYIQVSVYDSDQKVIKTYRAYLHLQTYAKAVIAKRDIPKGKVISRKDIVVKKIQVRNRRSLLSEEDIVGSVAKINIYKGKKITKYMIAPNYTIHKRQLVKILYDKGPIHIELLGVALQNGKRGDIIKVKNLSSNKVLVCKVLSNGVVHYLY